MRRVKAALAEVNDVVRNQTKSRVRKTLKPVQESVNDQNIAGKEMVYGKEKNLSATVRKNKTIEKIISAEKENSPSPAVVRRSKRKPAVTESVTLTETTAQSMTSKSTKGAKTKSRKPAPKSKKTRPTVKSTSEEKSDLNQTKLNFPSTPVIPKSSDVPESETKVPDSEAEKIAASFSSAVTEDSGYAPSNGTPTEKCASNSVVFHSPDVRSYHTTPVNVENCIITTGSPPIAYWMDLAEQRRIALEKTLQENEQIHDQLAVLEIENYQLKALLREAEHMARTLQGIIH